MVHVKRVELSHFKSFGGTTQIPILPGFTVISGPNGSGKSNILDALLFCLGLATSKGMRAERLPDLVNHNQSNNRNTAETSVSVTFDLSDWQDLSFNGQQEDGQPLASREWTVTRRLRVTKGGNYSSTYYINDEPCTVTELHEQLNRFRIYPEGYNIVLQGDVTRIITMNGRERREIIDELAGVAEFDRKIEKTKQTLEEVREREDRCRIIEEELIKARERLASDRLKAEKYQKLKAQIQEKQQWEAVLIYQSLQQQQAALQAQIRTGDGEGTKLKQALEKIAIGIAQGREELARLNQRVKALGEEEQLSVASQLASQKAKRHQLHQRQQELASATESNQQTEAQTRQEIQQQQQTLSQVSQEKAYLETDVLPSFRQQRDRDREALENSREQANVIASASEAWVQEQTALSRKIASLQATLNPQRSEQAQLTERSQQLQKAISEQSQRLESTERELEAQQAQSASLRQQVTTCQAQIQSLAQELAQAEGERNLQEETQTRLLKEQREKQRQLDKLEATKQAQQEAQGTHATQMILQSDLPGICGLVAQLGQVESPYQLALETSAGGRLGYLVVEDDSVAAAGIQLLKQKRAGRATFLPLNKIQPPRFQENRALTSARGFIDFAVNLVSCEPRYRPIFLYVFGNTVVFAGMDDARLHLGKYRMVTLEGELLETSGAMTGGSQPRRSPIHFGLILSGDSQEIQALKRRLADIEHLLARSDELGSQKVQFVKQLSQKLTEERQTGREQQLRLEQLAKEIERLTQQKEELSLQLSRNQQELAMAQNRLEILGAEIPVLEAQLEQEQQRLGEIEESQTNSEWQEIQTLIKFQESKFEQKEKEVREAEEQYRELDNKQQRLEEKILEARQRLQEYQEKKNTVDSQLIEVKNQLAEMDIKITETEGLLQQLNERLGETKKERDRAEETLHSLQTSQQQKSWNYEKLQETQQERQAHLETVQEQLRLQQEELPNPLPEISQFEGDLTAQLEKLQQELRNAQKRLEAMEPVNMLALEEYQKNQERLDELSAKLKTLEGERTELLLRIENFTTLRFRAFKDAFDAVNANFQTIFANLSEGDGYLQLDDAENPFNGGLNLVAHPKGKPVQRLSSMSGGEKSLTALSFIFALQRYRPSPFYAFDEVDMFLDGSNVERLAKMIRQQAQEAQFIVVSLRRPMIEASERTIGVTQARGAYTQVLGIKL